MKTSRILAALLVALSVTACGGGGGGASPPTGGSPPPPPVSPPPPAGTANITLNEATTYQTMDGWEATIDGDWDPGFNGRVNDAIQKAVDDLGIDRLRLEIQSSGEHTTPIWTQRKAGLLSDAQYDCLRYSTVNDNSDPNVINPSGFQWAWLDDEIDNMVVPMRNYLQSKGRQLWVNLAYVAFTDSVNSSCGGSYTVHTNPAEYAEFVLATYQHMQSKYGFVPDSWQVILEPDNGIPQWDDGVTIGNAIVAAAQRLQQAGFTPRFVAPSVTQMSNTVSYLNGINTVSGATQFLYEVSYHRYNDRSTSTLQTLANRAAQLGKKTAMLEWWVDQQYYNDLHDDLTIGNNSAWQGRTLLTHFKDPSTTGGVLTVQDNVRYTMQYFRAVRRGAVRFQAASTASQFQPIAFRNPDGSRTVVIKATGSGSVVVGGLPAGSYSVSWAVSSGSSRLSSPIVIGAGANLSTTMPGAGVMTISSLAGS